MDAPDPLVIMEEALARIKALRAASPPSLEVVYPARLWTERPVVLYSPSPPLPPPAQTPSMLTEDSVPASGVSEDLLALDDPAKFLERGGLRLFEDQFQQKRTDENVRSELAAGSKSGSMELFNEEGIKLRSELTSKGVVAAMQLYVMGERYGIPIFTHAADNFLKLTVSKERKGREEYIKGLHAEEKKEAGKDLSPFGSLMNTLMGKKGEKAS